MMKIAVMPDKFKGTLTSQEAAEAMCAGIRNAAREAARADVEILCRPMADGGEGTLHILTGGEGLVEAAACDALLRPIDAPLGIRAEGSVRHAIIESAVSIGLNRLSCPERNPEAASSYGLGLQIRSALEAGCRRLTIALGGTATNDAGAGMLAALGVSHYAPDGTLIEHPAGKDLININRVECSAVQRLLEGVDITVMCDVGNPLLGPEGATMVFGRQKGADEEMLQRLEAGMRHYCDLIAEASGRDLRNRHGSGAAGGIGWGLSSFSNARYEGGAATVARITGIDDAVRSGVSLIVTGEGRCDRSSLEGKVVGHAARLGRETGTPVIVLCGTAEQTLTPDEIRRAGIDTIQPLTRYTTYRRAVSHPRTELQRITKSVFAQIL